MYGRVCILAVLFMVLINSAATVLLGCANDPVSCDDCVVVEIEATDVEIDPLCLWQPTDPVDDPWNVTLEWRYSIDWLRDGEEPDPGGIGQTPIVARLEEDGASAVFITSSYGSAVDERSELIAVAGSGSETVFRRGNFTGWAAPIAADINGDGAVEIVATRFFDYLEGVPWIHALDAQGNVLWESDLLTDLAFLPVGAALNVADLENDGAPEVIYYNHILSGDDGEIVRVLDFHPAVPTHTSPTVADTNSDGLVEILLGGRVFSGTGELLWEATEFPLDQPSVFHAVADLDGDDAPEIVFVSWGYLAVYEHDGTLRVRKSFEGEGPPCIADLDGDGVAEFAVPTPDTIEAYDVDLVELWSQDTPHEFGSTNSRGCSAFDFDANGAAEVVYAGEENVWILDGATGHPLVTWTDHNTTHGHGAYPVVADVDADGSAEILFDSYPFSWNTDLGDIGGVTVLGHAGDGWPPAGPYWGVSDFAPLRIHPDGHVARPARPWWRYHNMYRARPPGDGLPDLVAVVGDVCVSSCDEGHVQLAWGIANQGLGEVYHPIRVALYRLEGGEASSIEVVEINEVIRYGAQVPGGVFDLDLADCGHGLRLVVDDDGAGSSDVEECNKQNNVWELPFLPCAMPAG